MSAGGGRWCAAFVGTDARRRAMLHLRVAQACGASMMAGASPPHAPLVFAVSLRVSIGESLVFRPTHKANAQGTPCRSGAILPEDFQTIPLFHVDNVNVFYLVPVIT